jgi:DNA-binding HxlR family transcriptional regulator
VTRVSHRPPRSGCAINAAIEVLGDPWSMLVLRDMVFGNKRHFRELLQGSDEGIASNILSSRLKRLVAAGLLTREERHLGSGRRTH